MTPEDTVRALYSGISYAPGASPDWTRVRSLFLDGARLVLPRTLSEEGGIYAHTADEWIAEFSSHMANYEGVGFREEQLAATTFSFRNIAHVTSSFIAHRSDKPEPIMRGINSFQLVRVQGRWLIASIVWDIEDEWEQLPETL